MFDNLDMKDYLLITSSGFLKILRLSPRINFFPIINIFPISTCNQECKMCFCSKKLKKKEVMEISTFKKVLDESSKYLIKPIIHFSGYGEPLTHPEFDKMISMCREKKMKWSITTNGSLLEKRAEQIVLNDCNAINISNHGTEKTHDRITGVKGAFKKTIRGIKKIERLKKEYHKDKPLIAINCVFNNENIPYLEKILDYYITLPVNSITFQHISFDEDSLEQKKDFLILKDEKIRKITNFIKKVRKKRYGKKINFWPNIKTRDIKGFYTDKNHCFKNSCIINWITIGVFPNGDVKSVCEYRFGNVKQEPLKKIINNEKARNYRKMIKEGKYNTKTCLRCCYKNYY